MRLLWNIKKSHLFFYFGTVFLRQCIYIYISIINLFQLFSAICSSSCRVLENIEIICTKRVITLNYYYFRFCWFSHVPPGVFLAAYFISLGFFHNLLQRLYFNIYVHSQFSSKIKISEYYFKATDNPNGNITRKVPWITKSKDLLRTAAFPWKFFLYLNLFISM